MGSNPFDPFDGYRDILGPYREIQRRIDEVTSHEVPDYIREIGKVQENAALLARELSHVPDLSSAALDIGRFTTLCG